tara:strand:+ start:921 stop:1193 length:273 start_codon:yes stop_codon:yes gene_type:complete
MINELQKQYEKEVARLKGAVEGFVKNNKPNYMPVNLGEAYKLRELDSTIQQLTEVEDKLACLTKNFTGIELSTSDDERFGMPTFEKGHSN